jgi:GNAT superfamily N-acetyltransferase
MTDGPAIRPATAKDVPALVRLLADDALGRAREADPGDPRYAAAFATIDADPDQMLIVMEDAGVIIGCLQLTFIPGLSRRGAWRGQIEAVRITASRRGQGLGRLMIGRAIDACRRRGCAIVQLTSNTHRTDAHRFYRSLGFVDSHVGFKLELSV